MLSAKSSRPRSNNSLVISLSLSLTIEGRRKSGRLSACASALVTNGISHIPSSKKGGNTSFGHGGYYNHQQHHHGGSSNSANNSFLYSSSSMDGSSPLLMRYKHPFPSSKGARSMALLVGGNTPNHLYGVNSHGHGYGFDNQSTIMQIEQSIRKSTISLPPLMTSIERKKQRNRDFVQYEKDHHLVSDRGVEIVKTVLE